VEHGIISSTKKSTAGEVQCQDHVGCVLHIMYWKTLLVKATQLQASNQEQSAI
jgi:hypothetical protein